MARITIAFFVALVGLGLGFLVLGRFQSAPGVGRADETDRGRASGGEATSSRGPTGSNPGFLGVVLARHAVDVVSKLDGRLESVRVRLGDRVKKGASIATIDVKAARQDLSIAEATLKGAQADQVRASLELAQAKERLARLDAMAQHVAREELATAQYQQKLAAVQLDSAHAQVAERQARVAQLREVFAHSEVRAPFDGVVAARYADPGATISPGTPLARLISDDELWVRFAIPEDQAASISVGRPINVSIESLHIAVPGKVASVAPEVDASSRMIFAEATLEVHAEERAKIPSGLVARVIPGP
ncbi:MAG: efflux RND transporter periplasmic adaptor subunit [Deltaproteobacteria bacterium]|nr:efflux RND transporter periplasmic adaptor subunit [Deltaproteobacteria bacterium]